MPPVLSPHNKVHGSPRTQDRLSPSTCLHRLLSLRAHTQSPTHHDTRHGPAACVDRCVHMQYVRVQMLPGKQAFLCSAARSLPGSSTQYATSGSGLVAVPVSKMLRDELTLLLPHSCEVMDASQCLAVHKHDLRIKPGCRLPGAGPPAQAASLHNSCTAATSALVNCRRRPLQECLHCRQSFLQLLESLGEFLLAVHKLQQHLAVQSIRRCPLHCVRCVLHPVRRR